MCDPSLNFSHVLLTKSSFSCLSAACTEIGKIKHTVEICFKLAKIEVQVHSSKELFREPVAPTDKHFPVVSEIRPQ